jgi:hypothetical protein
MRLYFPPATTTSSSSSSTRPLSAPAPITQPTPTFSVLAAFHTFGAVMNVFLLDPAQRVLSAFVWMSSTNTIGLFALLDWDVREYVFVDTGIFCVSVWIIPALSLPGSLRVVPLCETKTDMSSFIVTNR